MDEKNLDSELKNEDLFNSEEDEDDEDDIEFDDNVDIEALTKLLKDHVDVEDVENIANDDFNKEAAKPQPEQNKTDSKKTSAESFPKSECKKYVVYITPNNIDYVDALSIDERTELINDIIHEKKEINKKRIVLAERQRYINHLIVVCITVIISFPLLFYIVNKSLQTTISNYQQSQQNFQKLYKEKSKVKKYQNLDIK